MINYISYPIIIYTTKNSQKYYEMKDSIELQLKMTLKEKNEIYNVAVLAVKDDEKIRTSQIE
ncbi:hypothetical protein D9R21_06045 [Spiroplasma endosymbiont of Megaselia nigra]|nr:hypothetical protein D9R21_06045 [Spiroplasma endosymbiont of Megaselia nigra]